MKIKLTTNTVNEMTTDTIEVASTSAVTANASPIVLNQTKTLRLRFIPQIIDNKNEPNKSVSGKLLYERKQKSSDLFPSEDPHTKEEKTSRGSIKAGNWTEIALDSSETYALFEGLKELYKLYEDIGSIPYGATKYTKIPYTLQHVVERLKKDPSTARMIMDEKYHDIIKELLKLITQTDSIEALKKCLSDLQDENIQHLTTSLSIEKLQRVSSLIKDNLNNHNEEFWQSTVFNEHQWVLAQIFACPCTILKGKAYVGGKGINNSGGNICDFIYQNRLSQNVALIEIKTPCTSIIGDQYRNTYSFSYELSGAVNQVITYRDKLTKDYYSLCHSETEKFKVLSPQCVVIIGKMSAMDNNQKATFENYRHSLSNVTIITFDELYERISDLIEILSEDSSECKNPESSALCTQTQDEYDDDELPF